MDYASLTAPKGTKGSIANWIDYSDAILPLDDIILDAQSMLFQGGAAGQVQPLRVIAMQKAAALALAINTIAIAQPADFLSPVVMLNAVGAEIHLKDIGSLLKRRPLDTSGNPQPATYPTRYAVSGGMLQLDYTAMAATTLNLTYYAMPPFISETQDTNLLTITYPHLLRAACLVVAADYLNDDVKFNRNAQKLGVMLAAVNAADDLALMGMEVDRDDYR